MKENTPNDYVSLRLQVVHVTKKWGFHKDREIGFQICIPNTWEEADQLVGEIAKLMSKYGKPMDILGKNISIASK